MSLEAKIEVLTAAVQQLTQQIAANQNDGVPGFVKNARVAAADEPLVGEAHPPETAPKKRGRPAAAKAETETTTAPAKPAKPQVPLFDQLVEKVLALVEKDTGKVEAIFTSFGVAKASQLKPDQHEEALQAFTSALDEVNAAGTPPSYV